VDSVGSVVVSVSSRGNSDPDTGPYSFENDFPCNIVTDRLYAGIRAFGEIRRSFGKHFC